MTEPEIKDYNAFPDADTTTNNYRDLKGKTYQCDEYFKEHPSLFNSICTI